MKKKHTRKRSKQKRSEKEKAHKESQMSDNVLWNRFYRTYSRNQKFNEDVEEEEESVDSEDRTLFDYVCGALQYIQASIGRKCIFN